MYFNMWLFQISLSFLTRYCANNLYSLLFPFMFFLDTSCYKNLLVFVCFYLILYKTHKLNQYSHVWPFFLFYIKGATPFQINFYSKILSGLKLYSKNETGFSAQSDESDLVHSCHFSSLFYYDQWYLVFLCNSY